MCAMKSSVTRARATSVMSSWCLEISPSSRSNGPLKFSSRTSKGTVPGAGAVLTADSGCVTTGDQLAGQLAVRVGPGAGRGVAGDRLGRHGGVRELHGARDDGVEDLVPEGLHHPGDDLAAVQRAAVVHLSLIHISEPTRRTPISYAVFCLKKKH